MPLVIESLSRALEARSQEIRDGLDPGLIAGWYGKVISDAKRMAPPWLQDKIAVRQDDVITVRFKLDVSKRAVKYFMMAVDSNMPFMPYSAQMYFLKVQEIMQQESDRSLV